MLIALHINQYLTQARWKRRGEGALNPLAPSLPWHHLGFLSSPGKTKPNLTVIFPALRCCLTKRRFFCLSTINGLLEYDLTMLWKRALFRNKCNSLDKCMHESSLKIQRCHGILMNLDEYLKPYSLHLIQVFCMKFLKRMIFPNSLIPRFFSSYLV